MTTIKHFVQAKYDTVNYFLDHYLYTCKKYMKQFYMLISEILV